TQDDGKPIYGGFSATRPSVLGEGSWNGVLIGTEEEILTQWNNESTGLKKYTFLREDWYETMARVLNRFSGEEQTEEYWRQKLDEDYRKAEEEGRIGVFEASNSFSSSCFSYFRLSV